MTERVRVGAADLDAPSGVVLGGDAAHHLLRVSRVRDGDIVVAFDGVGRERTGRACDLRRGELRISWDGPARPGVVADAAGVRWIQCLPKGDKMDGIVRQAVELGVRVVAPAYSARSVPREVGARVEARVDRWRRIAEEAARQCGRADVPEVRAPLLLAEAIAHVIEAGRLFAWERATTPLSAALAGLRPEGGIAVVAGPEGGFGDDEAERVVGAAFVPVSLGPRVLRAETAAPAVLAIISAFSGDLAAIPR